MQKERTLYKRDNTGNTRVWYAEIDGRSYRLCSGQLGGKQTTSERTVCQPTNTGRANEKTAEEQCRAEVEALYKKKLKKGYTETLEKIDESKALLIGVMLAHDYSDYEIQFPCYTQPKLDGIRCIARADGLWSRKGEPIKTVPHIEKVIVPHCKEYGLVFDGELYNHVLKNDFNEIASLVRRQKQSPEHIAKVRDVVQYHIYDLVDPTDRYDDRWKRLKEFFNAIPKMNMIKLVDTGRVKGKGHLDEYYEYYVEQGYEGQMIRANAEYQFKRTKHLLKRKEFIDEEFEIIDMVEGKGNRSRMVGAIIFKTAEGKQFQAALMGSNNYRRRIWKDHLKNPFTGVDATVKYFHKTPDGIPRFPVVKSIDEGK